MTPTSRSAVTMLGLGEMGSALAATLVDAGHPVTVWNRTAGRAGDVTGRGAVEAASVPEAIDASPLVVACLFDRASVHEALDPFVRHLAGRDLVNLTTTTPEQARDLARWADVHSIALLDGGIMATPPMIGEPGASILYSGSADVFHRHRSVLDAWAESTYVGNDAGLASLWDLAMLAGMYTMFAGFAHGAAMVASAGVSATDFAASATPFIAAMTASFADFAAVVDNGDYAGPHQQSLEFSSLHNIVDASVDAGVRPDVVDAVQRMIRRQIDAGFGRQGFARIFEDLRSPGRTAA